MIYKVYTQARPTTAVLPALTSGTAIKTLLQVKFKTNVHPRLVAWGCMFTHNALATPEPIELIETGTVFATVTAHVANDYVKVSHPDAPDPTTHYVDVGTAAGGYNASAEGTITESQLFDHQRVLPTNGYSYEWSLKREPRANDATAIRIRSHTSASYSVIAWLYFEV